MARVLQIHSYMRGARTLLGRLAKALKSLAGNFGISLLGVFDECRRFSGKCRRRQSGPRAAAILGLRSGCCVDPLLIGLVGQRDAPRG